MASNLSIDCDLSGNKALSYGGGIYLDYCSPSYIGGTVLNNIANNQGGGLYLFGCNNMTIDSDIISNYGVYGGGLFGNALSNCAINGFVNYNEATWNGGGCDILGSSVIRLNGDFANNYACEGGGVFIYKCRESYLSGQIYNNRAQRNGGGLYLEYCTNKLVEASGSFGTIVAGIRRNRDRRRRYCSYLLREQHTRTGCVTNPNFSGSGYGTTTISRFITDDRYFYI
jgi:hypothetical protein